MNRSARVMETGSPGGARHRAVRGAGVLAVLALLLAASAASLAAERRSVRVLGDRDYPPITYLEDGTPRGFDVDIVRALGEVLEWDVTVDLVPWDLAQSQALEGKADFVTAMGVTEARRKVWDFATPTINIVYQLFVTAGEVNVRGTADLAGRRVAVTAGGLPRQFMEKRPGVNVVLMGNYEEGFSLLKRGVVDAVAADAWVAGYVINRLRIEDVVTAGEPFARLDAAIAIPRGNEALLREVNRGLALLDQRGTIAQIRARWEPKRVVYLLQEDVKTITLLAAGGAGLIVFAAMAAWILTLRREIAVRRRIEAEHGRAERELAQHREHLEELVRERTAELETANNELQAFSYTVSHDLRAPLRAIIGYSSILQKEADAANDQELLRRITRNAQRLGQMVDDLLDFSRLGRGELSVERFDPNPVVAEIIENARASYPRTTITAGSLPDMTGDRGLLRQVFENLIDNAFKFSGRADAPAVEVGARVVEGESVFFVRDNGAGFDMKYTDDLFAVFRRLHAPDEFQGTGVGLATVHRIVTRHGGRVWAESAPQAGATFYFTLKAQ